MKKEAYFKLMGLQKKSYNEELKAQVAAAQKAEKERKAAESRQLQQNYNKAMQAEKARQHQEFLKGVAERARKYNEAQEAARRQAAEKDRQRQAAEVNATVKQRREQRNKLQERLRFLKMTPAQRLAYNTNLARAISHAIPADSSDIVEKNPSYAMQVVSQTLPKSPAERTGGLAGYNEEQQIAQEKMDEQQELAQRQAAVPTEEAKAQVERPMAADQRRQAAQDYQKAINDPNFQHTQFGKDFVNRQIRQMNPVNYLADLLQGPAARLHQQTQIAQGSPSLSLLSRLARGGTMRPGEAGAHIQNLGKARAYENSSFWNKLWNWLKENWYKLTGNTYGANTTQSALARKARNAADAISASMQ